MNKKKTARKKRKKSASGNAADAAQSIAPEAFLERLRLALEPTSGKRGGARLPQVAWMVVDGWAGHREQLGLARLPALVEAIARRVQAALNPDECIADFGGGALALMLAADDDGGERAADLVRRVGGSLLELEDHTIAATVSLAVAMPSGGDDRPDRALVEAAAAAERASAAGGNRAVTCVRAPQPSDDPDRDLVRLLLDTIRDDRLRVVYQPLLGGGESTPVNYQMLPRLPGEDGELIPAARFVPVAARQGVLSTLDRWILGRAMKSLATFDNPEVLARLFVIQSPAIFEEPKLFEWFGRQLDAASGVASRLALEFAIGDVQPRLKAALPVLAALRERGVQVCIAAVDETVPAELVLEHVPADYLRMARGFVRQLLAGGEPEERFREFAAQARAAGRRIIVPMLEDAESVTRVWRMDVDLIQGNFIQEPQEAPDA